MPIKKIQREVMNAMIGTAGHVHHGKSALVEILTGCSMNRLPEEQERLLTINLGFAPCVLPGGRLIGIVDVPGHKDFIRNMVAGAASIDILMLVVAADDGVMPQTYEHLRIASLLSRPKVMVVLSKIDVVDEHRVQQVRRDLETFLAKMGFENTPILPMSNKTLVGLDEVREALDTLIAAIPARPADTGVFRMPVERVFSAKGHGTVVTGIPVGGWLNVEDQAVLMPGDRRCSVRAIQTYKQDAKLAGPHACAAINLRDADSSTITRGMMLTSPGAYAEVTSIIASLKNASDSIKVGKLAEVTFHAGTASSPGTMRILHADTLSPGGECFADIRMTHPMVLSAGDRYIVRHPARSETIGGGVVLSVVSPGRRRPKPRPLDRLEKALNAAESGELLRSELLAGPNAVISKSDAVRFTRHTEEAARKMLEISVDTGELIPLGHEAYAVAERIDEVVERVMGPLEKYHASHGLEHGMTANDVARLVGLGPRCAKPLCEALGNQQDLAFRHGRLALADFKPTLSAKLTEQRDKVLKCLQDADAPAVARGNVIEKVGINEADMKLILKLLVEDRSVVIVGTHLFLSHVYADCRNKLMDLFETTDNVQVGAFRKATGMSRNVAVALLESFDADGTTRRVDKGRILLKPRSR